MHLPLEQQKAKYNLIYICSSKSKWQTPGLKNAKLEVLRLKCPPFQHKLKKKKKKDFGFYLSLELY